MLCGSGYGVYEGSTVQWCGVRKVVCVLGGSGYSAVGYEGKGMCWLEWVWSVRGQYGAIEGIVKAVCGVRWEWV